MNGLYGGILPIITMRVPAQTTAAFFTAHGTRVHVKKNGFLFSPENEIHHVFYLEKGHVRQYGLTSEGVEFTIHIFSPGSFFPLTSILNDIPNSYFFQATTDCTLYRIGKMEGIEFLRKNPEVLYDLSTRLLFAIDKLSMRIGQLAYANAREKITSVLAFLSHHFAQQNNSGELTFTKKITHEDIASLAGLSRETVSREIKKLKSSGSIQYKKGLIILANQAKKSSSKKKL